MKVNIRNRLIELRAADCQPAVLRNAVLWAGSPQVDRFGMDDFESHFQLREYTK
jgi:hypothetical protein